MAFTPFELTKSWRSAEDFPSFEADESRVREDMQCLFDELCEGLNRLMSELKAGNLPFTPTAGVASNDVQNAIENVQAQIAGAIAGSLPDNSVTSSKFVAGAVNKRAVAAGAVDSERLEDGAVTREKLACGAVGGENIDDGAVSADKLDPLVLSGKADLVNGSLVPDQAKIPMSFAPVSRTLCGEDAGKLLILCGAGEITVPENTAESLPIGTEIRLFRQSSTPCSLVPAPGVVLYTDDPSALLAARYSAVTLKKLQANEWLCFGLGRGSVTGIHLAEGSVDENKLTDGSVGRTKLSADALCSPPELRSEALSYLSAEDTGKTVYAGCSCDQTLYITNAAFAALPDGAVIDVVNWSGNRVSITGESGVNLCVLGAEPSSSVSMNVRYGLCTLRKFGSAGILVSGNIAT